MTWKAPAAMGLETTAGMLENKAAYQEGLAMGAMKGTAEGWSMAKVGMRTRGTKRQRVDALMGMPARTA